MIAFDSAQQIILESVDPLGSERVCLSNAGGRILAEEIISTRTVPYSDTSARDGYAVRHIDCSTASQKKPVTLTVIDTVAAGYRSPHRLSAMEAIKIMTGAPIPNSATAVVPLEHTHKTEQNSKISITKAPKQGDHIRSTGSYLQKGMPLLDNGAVLTPTAIGILATIGKVTLDVYQRPTVAIFTTGDELIELGEDSTDVELYTSNSYILRALVEQCGALPMNLGIARDTVSDIVNKLEAASKSDIIITTGGVALGDADLIRDALAQVGADIKYEHVAMRPGHFQVFASTQRSKIYCLPGSSTAVIVSFAQFVRPALRKMMGYHHLFHPRITARLLKEITIDHPDKYCFIPARLSKKNGILRVEAIERGTGRPRGSHLEVPTLIAIPPGTKRIPANDIVEVEIIDYQALEELFSS